MASEFDINVYWLPSDEEIDGEISNMGLDIDLNMIPINRRFCNTPKLLSNINNSIQL